jgi:ribosomal protein L37E
VVQWPPDWQQKIIDALTQAGADRPCPRCGHEDFNLVDGYVSLPLQAKVAEGPSGSIPTVVTICERCGYVSQHALTVLLAADIDGPGGPNGTSTP